MAIIKKKIPPEYFDLVNSGKKNFELRVAEFEIDEGDTILLEEWDPKTKQYTGRTIEREAGYILKFGLNTFGQEDLIKEKGLVVISLKEKTDCKTGVKPNVIDKEVFDREIYLCKKLGEKCGWGKCENCGVPMLLHKLYEGVTIDDPEEIKKIRKELF